MSSLFGLAPGGVYRAAPVAGSAVRSYRTLSPLPAGPWAGQAVCFLWHFPLGSPPAGRYPAPYFRGARTFLSQRSPPSERSSGRLAEGNLGIARCVATKLRYRINLRAGSRSGRWDSPLGVGAGRGSRPRSLRTPACPTAARSTRMKAASSPWATWVGKKVPLERRRRDSRLRIEQSCLPDLITESRQQGYGLQRPHSPVRRLGSRGGPESYSLCCQSAPVEQLAGVFLARWSHIGVVEVRKIPCRSMIPRARAAKAVIWATKGPIAPFVPRVDQFHADRPAVDISAPPATSRRRHAMPAGLPAPGRRPSRLPPRRVMSADLGLLIA